MATPKKRFRTVFISDVHLGTPMCQADKLLQFLKEIDVEQIYLVGDIIDMWALKKRMYWTPTFNLVIRRLLRLSKNGVKITYIPGNHNENLRSFFGENFGGILIFSATSAGISHHGSPGHHHAAGIPISRSPNAA